MQFVLFLLPFGGESGPLQARCPRSGLWPRASTGRARATTLCPLRVRWRPNRRTVIRRKSGTASGDHRFPGRTEAATQALADWRVAFRRNRCALDRLNRVQQFPQDSPPRLFCYRADEGSGSFPSSTKLFIFAAADCGRRFKRRERVAPGQYSYCSIRSSQQKRFAGGGSGEADDGSEWAWLAQQLEILTLLGDASGRR